MKNAVILAAGKSSRFAPFTYEKPKGLFRVKGEILIERQIEQLHEAGVRDIAVVVGYMKEKFFYLEQKYSGVRLVVNNKFGMKGNLYSLYVAREFLADTFLCYADQYFVENPFLDGNAENRSYHAFVRKEGRYGAFSLTFSDANVITSVDFGGCGGNVMIGHAYFNKNFSDALKSFLDSEISEFRVASLFWEEFFARHIRDLTLFAKRYDEESVLEFNSIEDLRRFDSDFLYNVDSEIISNICGTLNCHPNLVQSINVINAGLTNVSFSFSVGGIQYVYRHPGGTAGNLIDRQAEIFAQNKAKALEIDKSVIAINPKGWKLSYYVENLVPCDFRKNEWQLQRGMEYLRLIHGTKTENALKIFDDYEEGIKLMKIASATKGNLLIEFAEETEKARRLNEYLKKDAERLGYSRVLCHNDVYEPNFLATEGGGLYLIDWEYAGLNYAANDIACFFCRYDYEEAEIERFLREYFARELTADESRFYTSFIPLCAFYWFCWGLYKGSVGDDDGFFFLPAYRNFQRFIDSALKKYELKRQRNIAMILAGGSGTRFGADRPKQFVEVYGKPVLVYTAEIFERNENIDAVEIVCHADWTETCKNLVKQYGLKKVRWITEGGENFQKSVMNGIAELQASEKNEISDDDVILIHYAASPFTERKIVDSVIEMTIQKGSAVSATPCYQLMGTKDGEQESKSWTDRDKFIQIASPQGFRFGFLKEIYEKASKNGLIEKSEPHTTSLMYALNLPVNLAYGNQTNIKITTKEDLELFKGYLVMKKEENELYTHGGGVFNLASFTQTSSSTKNEGVAA